MDIGYSVIILYGYGLLFYNFLWMWFIALYFYMDMVYSIIILYGYRL